MHPYENLPDDRFWRRAVSNTIWSEINFKPYAKFKLNAEHRIATGGSCFAQHLAQHLDGLGLCHYLAETPPEFMSRQRADELQYGGFSARYGNIYTVRQLRQLIEFTFGVRDSICLYHQDKQGWVDLLRPGVQAEGYASLAELESDRAWHLECVRRMFLEVDCFIFTLGLTEAWYHHPSGIVFPVCPGTKAGVYDPAEHQFVNFRFRDILEDLQWCIDFMHERNPALKWVLTVSPVALAATATDRHVLVATAASKAILRAAVDEVCEHYPYCDYFPSFEIVSSAPSFGQFLESDLRSISPRGVALVMENFRRTFMELEAAEAVDRLLCPRAGAAVFASDKTSIAAAIETAVQRTCDESFHDPGERGF